MVETDNAWRQRFRRNLRAWFDRSSRDLPWRRDPDPYRIWISEIMLQQTTVAAVIPFYERFVGRFPSLESLSEATETEVLRYWEGLGYYSRARNIHRTARHVANDLGGALPSEVDALRRLPGIGRYTAGAIASFAFDRRAPIVEANTLRLYSRLLAYRGDPRSGEGQQVLWRFAEEILPRTAPGRFNLALMDLGATICSPARPDCGRCPVSSSCGAFAAGAQTEIPLPKARPAVTDVTEASIAVRHEGKFLLRRRGERERWAGLWDFPRFELSSPSDELERLVERRLADATGIRAAVRRQLTEFRHGVTRYRIRLLCFLAEYEAGADDRPEQAWVAPEDFEEYPLSVTGRKLARLLVEECAAGVA